MIIGAGERRSRLSGRLDAEDEAARNNDDHAKFQDTMVTQIPRRKHMMDEPQPDKDSRRKVSKSRHRLGRRNRNGHWGCY